MLSKAPCRPTLQTRGTNRMPRSIFHRLRYPQALILFNTCLRSRRHQLENNAPLDWSLKEIHLKTTLTKSNLKKRNLILQALIINNKRRGPRNRHQRLQERIVQLPTTVTAENVKQYRPKVLTNKW